jgi:putative tricarboxylic transport membrane protein
MKQVVSRCVGVFGVALLLSLASAQFTPGNVECIAPASAGGGWDFTCRVPAAQVMPELGLVPGSIQVTNLSGGGGGVAYANVVTQREGDEDLIVAASVATATRLAQNVFAGFTADNVRWFGALGADYGILAVDVNSDYATLDDLLAVMQDDPEALTFVGGSAVGGFDHIKVLQLARAAGIEDITPYRYVSFDGGATAIVEIKGGRADVFTGDASEVVGELDAGTMRALAIFAPERIDRLPDVPAATELGYDVIAPNWRGFYGAPGISDEAYDYWVGAVETVANSEEWQTLRDQNGLAPFASFGADFETFVREQIEIMRGISEELGVIQ